MASKVLTTPRIVTLASSVIVSLSSGTNYVYSAYAPQLGSQLLISHTKLNVIGLAGNIGVYSSGPFWGRLVDRRGPKILLASAFALLLAGYSGIRHFYDTPDLHDPNGTAERISHNAFLILILCSFLSGAGGNAGLTSAVNATAKSFPDEMRATSTGIVLSGFGLSAFFFSALAGLLYPGDTSSLLLFLSLGTSFPMILGYFFVRPIPLPPVESLLEPSGPAPRRLSLSSMNQDGYAHSVGVDGVLSRDNLVFEHTNDSRTTLLATHQEIGPRSRSRSIDMARSPPPPPLPHDRRHRSRSAVGHGRNTSRIIEVMRDLHGKQLFGSADFWLLFSILSLLSGTGIMYINNVGSIAQALYVSSSPTASPADSLPWQSLQVSTISIANCAGRIVSGLSADLVKNRLALPRTYCIAVIALLFVLSQFLATRVQDVAHLWAASALLGLAYGAVFGLFPTVVIEWFGLAHFSENWGFVSLSPMLGGNLFSIAFGHNLDAHSPPEDSSSDVAGRLAARAGLPAGAQCYAGRACYVSSLYLTMGACFVATILGVYAAYKDRRRMTVVKPTDYEEILWEEEEDLES